LNILVLEDDPLLAMQIADELQAAGYAVIGPATTVEAALALIQRQRPDATVLDVNMGDGTSMSVAEALRALGVPFLALTGNAHIHQPPVFRDAPWLAKPYREQALKDAVMALAAEAAAGVDAAALSERSDGEGLSMSPDPATIDDRADYTHPGVGRAEPKDGTDGGHRG
jgi:two-component system, response regulator PdtaR